jgi:hypothetical protein
MVNIYTTLTKSLNELERIISNIIPTDEYDPNHDYSGLLNNLNQFKTYIIRLLSVHKFARMSKEYFLAQFSGVVETNYKIKDYDTPLSLADKFGVDLDALLEINNIVATDIQEGLIIKVPVAGDSIAIYSNVPTFGDQTGDNVFGRDLPNELVAVNGKLVVLEPLDNLKQGILNRITTWRGEYPLDDSFGINNFRQFDLPEDLAQNMVIMDVVNQILQDARIAEVNEIVQSSEKDAVQFTAEATTITKTEVKV